MVGDYISTSFIGGRALPVFAIAGPIQGAVFDEPIATIRGGVLPATPAKAASLASPRPAAPTSAPVSTSAR
jgi:hypothetical protein